MPRTLLILPWERPLLPQLVTHLTASCDRAPWDLRSRLIVVPTQESGRRLREALAVAAARAGTGVLAPTLVTPDQLAHHGLPEDTATPRQAEAAWCSVLTRIDPGQFPAVFPRPPARRDAAWVTSVAAQLTALQEDLREHALDFGDVSRQVIDSTFEPERWAQLAELEAAWRDALAGHGLADPGAAPRIHIADTEPPPGITHVVVSAVPDPAPLAVQLLSRWSAAIAVEVLCHGPTDTVIFDDWGRPLPAAVDRRGLPWGARAAVHPVRDTRAAAQRAAAIARAYAPDLRTVAIAAVNPDSADALQLALSGAGVPTYDPAGRSLAAAGIGLLATSLLRLALDPNLSVAAQVLRHPRMGHYAASTKGWAIDQGALLNAFDQLLNEHLPGDLQSAAFFARSRQHPEGLRRALDWLVTTRRDLSRPNLASTLQRLLSEVMTTSSTRRLDGDDEAARALGELLGETALLESRFTGLSPEIIALMLLRGIRCARTFPGDSSDAVDLQGWLELGYEDAPHLVLVGFNEGCVPETLQGGVFLPNSLRERLGLRGNRERFSRDLVLLEAHLRSRSETGRVDLLVPRMGDDGDPIQPSRLLFQCADHELVARARTLFAELPPPPAAPARRAAWKLGALPGKLPKHHSPSSIKAYLNCPYRYYLTHILRAKSIDVGLQEIPASVFGDLCHQALQQLGETPALHDVEDPTTIGDFLVSEFEAAAKQQLGNADSFALRVQLEAGKARLRAAASVESEQRRAGWRILRCESPWSIEVRGFTFTGRIDRVDRHVESGLYRLIDYKTSDSGRPPEEAHWVRARDGEAHVLPQSIFDRAGKPWRWLDLQLPLYLLATRAEHGGQAGAGYFVLPKTKEDTGVKLWTDLTPELLTHAEECAVAVAEAIAARRFWPPAARLSYEAPSDYLFPDGIEANVDPEALAQLAANGGAS